MLASCPGGSNVGGGSGEESCQLCGESEAWTILDEFRRHYESKLQEIDTANPGNTTSNMQRKLQLQQKWIEALTEQTQMMTKVIQELETEATGRGHLFDGKLPNNTKTCGCENVYCLEHDVQTLLELIQRGRTSGDWSTQGLHFYAVSAKDLLLIGNEQLQTGNLLHCTPSTCPILNEAKSNPNGSPADSLTPTAVSANIINKDNSNNVNADKVKLQKTVKIQFEVSDDVSIQYKRCKDCIDFCQENYMNSTNHLQ